MDPLESIFLKVCGYIPANVQACRDYTAGIITQQQMWKILNKNINLIKASSYYARPTKGDIIKKYDEDNEWVYGRINWVSSGEVFCTWFKSRDTETFDLADFSNYSSIGGRTTWKMQDD